MENKKKPRVVVYCRLSRPYKKHIAVYVRGGDDASVERQIDYYKEKYNHDEEIEVVGFYADIGTGHRTKNRPGFQNLIADCCAGKVQEVHAKSVSRFSRNTAELIRIIKELKDLGVAVVFEAENINTLTNAGDILISVLVAIATEEAEPKNKRIIRCGSASTTENEALSKGYKLQAEHYKATLNQEENKAMEDKR